MSTALCTPNAAWSQATQAGLKPIETPFSQRTVPVEHRVPGTYTFTRAAYPLGVVLIPSGSDPSASPAVLPAFVTGTDSQALTLDPADLQDCSRGGGVVFL